MGVAKVADASGPLRLDAAPLPPSVDVLEPTNTPAESKATLDMLLLPLEVMRRSRLFAESATTRPKGVTAPPRGKLNMLFALPASANPAVPVPAALPKNPEAFKRRTMLAP